MKTIVGLGMMCLAVIQSATAQVDTSFVYRTDAPFGTLDIRIRKSATRYYYLEENKTYSYRESAPGVKTESYQDMTSWDSSPYTQGHLREKNGSSDYFLMNYRLLFPVGYNASYADGYPLILMVHGAGERGNCWDYACHWADRDWRPQINDPAAPTTANHQLLNNDHNLLHGGQVHLDARNLAGSRLPNDPTMPSRAFPGFVLFPQNLNGWDANGVQDMIRIVRLLTKKYNIDQNRIYIHGLSNGGYGVYETLKRAPWLFSAALPMSAINDAQLTTNVNFAPTLKEVSNIPLWIFQGGIDTNPVPSKTRNSVKKFRDEGFIVRYNEYSNLGHGTWNTAYNEPDFFTWILSKNKSNIHSFGGISAICRTNEDGLTLELSSGFLAYQWERNGVIIDSANGPTYVAHEPGIYRARFSRVSATPSEGEWNRWSDPVNVTESFPVQPQITQSGSVILKDLNNYNNAHVHAVGEFAHYYWYKDGALLDLPGNQDDTTKNPIFKAGACTNLPACTGNGTYTLITAGLDNCSSPPSEPLSIYFNNQAPVNITAPTSFTGSATSPSEASLNWNDASSGELGFEVWRRKNNGDGTFSIWNMAALTPAGTTSFDDSGLEPSSVYQYKIRAVGSNGRSNYTPSASNQFLTITTLEDELAPTAPQNLTALSSGIRQITLNWQASSDNTGIRHYLIFFDDDTVQTEGAVTSYVMSNLSLNHEYSFTVKAVDLGDNPSDASNSAEANTFVTGLYYEHSTGGWTDLDQIDWNIAEYNGQVTNFSLTPRTQEDYFNFQYEGYLYINIGGSYQFRTTSDDGSRLTLNDNVIVENDGLHGNVTVTSTSRTLAGGPQLINVKYFEYTGGQTLTVSYRGPDTGNNWVNIPDAALKSGNQSSGALRIATAGADRGNQNHLKKLQARVYPNPARGHEAITLVADDLDDEPVHISVRNFMGESFYESTMEAAAISGGMQILPAKQMTKGIYVVAVRQGNRTEKYRMVIKD